MKSAKKVLGRAAKALGMLMALAVIMLAVGCGKDGKIYGSVIYDGIWVDGYVGGFPSYAVPSVYYEIKEGTYDVYYLLTDGTSYYPGYYYTLPTDSTTYYHFTYTVTADSGSFPFVDGKDRRFGLYLAYDWLYLTGDVKGLPIQRDAAAPKSGTRTWTVDGLKITVTGSVVALTPDQVSKLPRTKFQK